MATTAAMARLVRSTFEELPGQVRHIGDEDDLADPLPDFDDVDGDRIDAAAHGVQNADAGLAGCRCP